MKYLIVLLFLINFSFSQDIQELIKKAEQGDSSDQIILGNKYRYGIDLDKNIDESLKWYKSALDQGNVDANLAIGLLYYNEGDKSEALKWLEVAANLDVIHAQSIVAWMYEKGHGVDKNIVKAKEWYKKSCDNNEQDSCDAYKKLKDFNNVKS